MKHLHTQKEHLLSTSDRLRPTIARGANSDLLEHNECAEDSTVSSINPNNGLAVSNFRNDSL